MAARTYWEPMDIGTGTPAGQPGGAKVRDGWRLRNGHFQETCFLDAPVFLPAGGTRGIDCGRTTLGVAHLPREGTWS